MSRIGNWTINVPAGVKVILDGDLCKVEGPKGKLEQEIHPNAVVQIEDTEINIKRKDESILSRSVHGLTRTLVNNMIVGVTNGYEMNLEIVGVGFRANLKGKDLDLSLGFSHPVVIAPPEGIEFAVENPQKIAVKGIDKQLVGQVAANIRKLRQPEPYKGKGIRYAGEYVAKKAGKTGK